MSTTQYISRVSLSAARRVESFDRYPFVIGGRTNSRPPGAAPKAHVLYRREGFGASPPAGSHCRVAGVSIAEEGNEQFSASARAGVALLFLHEYLRIAKGVQKPKDGFFLRAESFFNVATGDRDPRFGIFHSVPLRYRFLWWTLTSRTVARRVIPCADDQPLWWARGSTYLTNPRAALSPQRQLAVLSRIHDHTRRVSVHHCHPFAHSHGRIRMRGSTNAEQKALRQCCLRRHGSTIA